MFSVLHRVLAWSVVFGLLLPVVIVLLLGLAGLLAGVRDEAGGLICLRIAMGLGVGWVSAIAITAVTVGVRMLEQTENARTNSAEESSEKKV
ncbi:MAG: hypothetical protein HN985_08840 [Planctomycetaceae bacterium]|nr:hypothetical protein [Planctomycetaceae bacterium]MBT6919815.1 hypothetical protein [Planctomycetaceae bacterium]MBT7728004.1 hypothetical protein [Planctomycetaceae bacterium]